MGGSQSVRKITIDNNNTDVIKVSQSVVERLKSGSLPSSNKNQDDESEQPKQNLNVPQVPSGFHNFPAYPYPYSTSSGPVQEEIQKEVNKTNEYWKQRISKLENLQEEISQRMQNEYEKTMSEFEKVLPDLGTQGEKKKNDLSDLNHVKDQLIKCYRDNKGKSLNCSAEVENFNKCFEEKRALQRQRS